jgi:serine/threonine-protein kinase
MASVYLAEDVRLGRRVAIKRVHPERSIDVAPRFRREMRLAASLSHPNLVRLLDAIVEDGAVLLVMEYVEGETLAERLRQGPLELPIVREVLHSLADAVDYLHDMGVIHRDIKPANILVDRAGRVKLTDLGIASAAEATGITTSGSVLGTPAYMAPELFEGRRAGPAADVYSLAAVTFEMLTGARAQRGTTVPEIALRVARDAPPDLREHWPDAGALAAALQRGMARRPNERPSTASILRSEVEVGLREAQERRTIRPSATAPRSLLAPTTPVPARSRRPPDRPGRSRRLAAPLLLAALILVAGAVVAIVLTGGGGGAAGPQARGTTADGAPGAGRTTRSTPGGTAQRRVPSPTTDRSARGGTGPAPQPSSTPRSSSTPRPSSAPSATSRPSGASRPSEPQAAAPAGVQAEPTPDTPQGAVRAFYERAAADRYDDAWALAAPELRAQLQGYRAFRAQFGSVRSIRFNRAEVVRRAANDATVAIATTATHTSRVDRCSGTATAARAPAGGWMVSRVSVSC